MYAACYNQGPPGPRGHRAGIQHRLQPSSRTHQLTDVSDQVRLAPHSHFAVI
jgi:hypothetical protein